MPPVAGAEAGGTAYSTLRGGGCLAQNARRSERLSLCACVRVRLLRELASNRESLVATHLSFPSVRHVAVDGNVLRWVPGPWEY